MLNLEPAPKRQKTEGTEKIRTLSELLDSMKLIQPIVEKSAQADLSEEEAVTFRREIKRINRYLNNDKYLSPLVELATFSMPEQTLKSNLELLLTVEQSVRMKVIRKSSPELVNSTAELIFFAEKVGAITTSTSSVVGILKFLNENVGNEHFTSMLEAVPALPYPKISAIQHAIDAANVEILSFLFSCNIGFKSPFYVGDEKMSLLQYLAHTGNIELIKLVSNHPNFKMTVEDEIEMLIFKRKNPTSPVCKVLPSRFNHLDVEYALLSQVVHGDLTNFNALYLDRSHDLTADIWMNCPKLTPYSSEEELFLNLSNYIHIIEISRKLPNAQAALSLAQALEGIHNIIENAQTKTKALNIRSHGGKKTLIGLLIKHNKLDTLQMMLSKGANIEIVNANGETPLMTALQLRNSEAAKILIERGANVNSRNYHGRTPIFFTKNIELLNLLVSNGADVNAKDNSGNTTLINDFLTSEFTTVSALIKLGANPNIVSNNGTSALSRAVERSEDGMVEFLLDNGADVNLEHDDKMTPLLIASRETLPTIANDLIQRGADVHATDNQGYNAIYHAVGGLAEEEPNVDLYKSAKDMVNLCIRHGVNPIVLDEDGDNKIISSLDDLIKKANEEELFEEAQILIEIKQELEAYIETYQSTRAKLDSSLGLLPDHLQESLLFAPVSSIAITPSPEESAKIKHNEDIATSILLKLEREKANDKGIS